MHPITSAPEVGENERRPWMARGQFGELRTIGRLLTRPIDTPALPDMMQDRPGMPVGPLGNGVEQAIVRPAACRQFHPHETQFATPFELVDRVIRVVGVDDAVSTDPSG